MAVKQKGRKRTRRYYERNYAAIGLEAVKCLLCGDWFGVKASVFKLNLSCPTCEKRLEKECRVCNGLGNIVKNEAIEECPECGGSGKNER